MRDSASFADIDTTGAAGSGISRERVVQGLSLVLISAVLGVFFVLKEQERLFREASPDNVNLVLVLCAFGLLVRGRDLPMPFRILFLYLIGSLVFYLAASYRVHDLNVGHPAADWKWLLLAFGVGAIWRPSLALLPVMAVQWNKRLVREDIGMGITSTDYMVVLELGVYLCLVIVVVSIAKGLFSLTERPWPIAKGRVRELCRQELWPETLRAGVVVGAAIHLANYFYSAIAKLILVNAGPLDWMIANPTYVLTLNAAHFEYLTIFELPFLPAETNLLLAVLTVPLNIAVLVAQLVAPLAVFSRRFMIGITVVYDIMHVAIFALSAIFFWKWILLNLGFVHAFSTFRREARPISPALGIYALIMLLTAPYVFQVAKLGWFDSGGVNYAHVQAETIDGRRVDVPSNFFLEMSVVFAQQRAGRPFDGFFPTHDWGTSQDQEVMQRFTERCEPADPVAPNLDPETVAHVGDLIWKHHDRVLALEDGGGRLDYDLYPHHIWSSPVAYDDFRALDLQAIRAYVLVVEALCIAMDPASGEPEVTLIAKGVHRFPARIAANTGER